MKISKEAKIGLFAFAMLIVLYWGINFLNKNERLKRTTTYYVAYPNASGLQRKSPVMINGVAVGSVSAVELGSNSRGVVATLQIGAQHKLPVGTTAAVGSGGILDRKSVTLTLAGNPAFHKANDTLKASPAGSDIMGMVGPMASKADSLLAQLSSVAAALQATLNVQNQAYIASSLSGVAVLSESLNRVATELGEIAAENRKGVSAMVSELSQASGNLNAISGNLKSSNEEITSLISNAAATFANAQALTETLNRHTAQGTLLSSMRNDSLYVNLNRAVQSLNALLVDLKNNPKSYVHFSMFGGEK
ncbi:MAG: MlaD family protein, partial [Prevotellaceae bacterium]|jgi:phospholipid/cholesterol/gamma-HCH transport system substrate-binding protein|nr:MlaD family protein [Prevotellaceae bacterium]